MPLLILCIAIAGLCGCSAVSCSSSAPPKAIPESINPAAGDHSLFPAPSKPGSRLFPDDLLPGGNLHFTRVTDETGIHLAGVGMGVALGDFDNDGDLDFLRYLLQRQQVVLQRCQWTFHPSHNCWSCHNQPAEVDNVFVQFYPVPRAVRR